MDPHSLKFRVSPRIFKADEKCVVTIEGLDESTRLFDDLDYTLSVSSKDTWNYKDGSPCLLYDRDLTESFKVRSKGGIIKFEYFFRGETEWRIRLSCEDASKHLSAFRLERWPYCLSYWKDGIEFKCYSLKEDLYGKKAFKGDFHIHTAGSDGKESAELTAANYRKFGYDAISVTDHYTLEPSLKLREYLKNIDTDFCVIPGEEIHQQIAAGSFHMISLDPKKSVNDMMREDPEKCEAEIWELTKDIPGANKEDRYELAWYKWVYKKTKEAGGLSVYPHPFWDIIGGYNIRTKTSLAIMEDGYCDAFEIMGGTCDKEANRRQAQLYYDVLSRGKTLPIIGATDSHGSLKHGLYQFDQVWSVYLAERAEDLVHSVEENLVGVVDNYVPTSRNVYGPLRIVEYIWFLIENYYEKHDELCLAIGSAMQRYVYGDKSQAKLISMLEDELRKYNEEFYGR